MIVYHRTDAAVALTAARANQLLAYRNKIRVNPSPQPPTEEELTQVRLKLDWALLRRTG